MVDSTIEHINSVLVVGFSSFGIWVLGVAFYHVFTG